YRQRAKPASSNVVRTSAMYRTVKRATDIAGATFGLVVFAIPMVVIAALVRLTLGSPVIFRQPRPGLRERTFDIYKFRTMRDTPDADSSALSNHLRVTRL